MIKIKFFLWNKYQLNVTVTYYFSEVWKMIYLKMQDDLLLVVAVDIRSFSHLLVRWCIWQTMATTILGWRHISRS